MFENAGIKSIASGQITDKTITLVAEFNDRGILWTVPCDKRCNSSKGKKDLIDWWVNHKGYNFTLLSTSVSSIFCRAKYRHMNNNSCLFDEVPNVYLTALQQVKDNWGCLI